jgi:hypothetical protein
MKLHTLGQRGHIHFVAPILVIVVVGAIGTYVYKQSQAQSLPCNSQTLAATTGTKPVQCVQYIQQMLNGIYARNVGADPGNKITGLSKDIGYAKLTQGSYKSDLLLVNDQFGKVSSVYDTATVNQVTIFQKYAAQHMAPAPTPKPGVKTPPVAAPTPNGKVDAATWVQLCADAVNAQLSSDGHTLAGRDIAVVTHTPEGYADSYRRAGVSAGLSAGCMAPPKSTGSGGSGSGSGSGSGTTTASNFNECMELGGTEKQNSNGTETCTLKGKSFTVASDDVIPAWGPVKSSTVHLLKWKISFTAPQSLVGGLYYQVDPGENIYDFTTTKMFAPACIAYFNAHGQEASVEFDQFVPSKTAKSIDHAPTNAGTMTLAQYYTAHKATGGNYFLDAKGRKVWKVGNHFYDFLTDTSLYTGTAFTKACPGVTSQYQTLLAAAIPTVKE